MYICALFARAVWEREDKVIGSKEREAGRRRWVVTGDSCWHTALMHVEHTVCPITNCHQLPGSSQQGSTSRRAHGEDERCVSAAVVF